MLLLLLMTTSFAQRTEKDFVRYVPGGFLNAGDFRDLPSSVKEGYVMGFSNGMMASGILEADVSKVKALHDCTNGMSAKQLAAILDKYLSEHPEGWHEPLAVHSFDALLGVCPSLRKQLLPESKSQ